VAYQSLDPDAFVAAVHPLLKRKDAPGLLALLKNRWSKQDILGLLTSRHEDARKVAALSIGMVGTECCLEPLATLLKDPDPVTNQMAEHAMWSIWFRLGSPEANHQLARGALALNRRELVHAMEHFDRAVELSPDFAEAYNQRAITWHLMEKHQPCIDQCRRAVERMPMHFGAWSGMGHSHANLGEFDLALDCYRRALEINPHLEGVRQSLEHLQNCSD
jgi:tetratricopeptide (TPR) repeat protein